MSAKVLSKAAAKEAKIDLIENGRGTQAVQDAKARLAALTGVLTAPSQAPALVVAAVAHGELLATTPFGWGDGLIARALFRLLLVARGLDPTTATLQVRGVFPNPRPPVGGRNCSASRACAARLRSRPTIDACTVPKTSLGSLIFRRTSTMPLRI